MRTIEREDLHIGYVISYTVPGSSLVLHGSIVHIGHGLAARNTVWIRCTDGYNIGQVECVMLDTIVGVMSYA
jgi:hypothetical protein